jgi:hypothetical protein
MKDALDIGDLDLRRDDFNRKIGAVPLAQLAVDALRQMGRDRIPLRIRGEHVLRTPRYAQPAGFAQLFVDVDLINTSDDARHLIFPAAL